MATNAGAGAARQLQSARTATAVWKKYTVQSHGIWDRIRRALAIDPERSTGVPLNPQYRNPPPGANPPGAYDDPVTVPAGDLAENPYYKRDIRRSYPRLSVVKQADVVGLLSVGSKAHPKDNVLQIGEAGAKQLVQVKQEGEQQGLAAFFEKDKNVTAGIFGPDGLPPFPSGMSRTSPIGGKKYVMDADREQGYPEELIMSVPQESMSFQLSPVDIVLSCTICQETFSTIYADNDQINGLCKDGEDPRDSKITKLWLTECAHLTCGKHLPGGGVPFHSIHEVPRAPCPLCSAEKDDHSEKALFFINGTSKGQYDENIPDIYFQTPPGELSGVEPGLEALRFQYLSLLRSGIKKHERVMELMKALKRWEDKKPEIVRSLSIVAPLRDELLSAGQRLTALGEDVSSIKTTLKLAGVNLTEGLRPQQQTNMAPQYHDMDPKRVDQNLSRVDGCSRLARGSAADLDSLNQDAGIFKGRSGSTQQNSMPQYDNCSKRKRMESRDDTRPLSEYPFGGGGFEKSRSRDEMPPPPIPIQQPLVYAARVPSSDMRSLNSQRDYAHATHSQQAPTTPQRYPPHGGLSHSLVAPSLSIEPSNNSLAPTRTNVRQSHADHHYSSSANTGIEGSVYVRGGWQPPPQSHDTERSENDGSPSLSLPSTGQQPAQCAVGHHQGSLIFPIGLGDRIIDPGSRNYQSVSSDRSALYHRRQSPLATEARLEQPTRSRPYTPSPNREGRITLPRTPSFASRHFSDQGVGLSSHVRSSSSRQTNHQSANSSSHRKQLAIATPAHQHVRADAQYFTAQSAHSSSLPSLGGRNTEILRRNDSFDTGPTPMHGEMRPYSSASGANFLLAQDPPATSGWGQASLMGSRASSSRRRANR